MCLNLLGIYPPRLSRAGICCDEVQLKRLAQFRVFQQRDLPVLADTCQTPVASSSLHRGLLKQVMISWGEQPFEAHQRSWLTSFHTYGAGVILYLMVIDPIFPLLGLSSSCMP